MQGPRGLHHNTPRNLGEVRAANHGGWQPTLAYRDRQSCAARKRRSLLVSCIIWPVRPGPSRPNKRARVFSIQSAVNASMVEPSDYELGGLEQVARADLIANWRIIVPGLWSRPNCGHRRLKLAD